MEKTRRQHYVPRMYMKRFGYGSLNDRKISVLKLDTGKIVNDGRIENFAVSNMYYDTNSDELNEILEETFLLYPQFKGHKNIDDPQFIEHAYARQEGAISTLLDELEKDMSLLNQDSYKAKFIDFIHSLAYRTKSYRDSIDAINQQTEKFICEICDKMGLSESEKRKTIDMNCRSGKQTQLYQMTSIVPVLQTMKMLVEQYNWYEGYNNTKLDFIISDNPAETVRLGFNDICIPICCSKAVIMRIKDNTAPLISKDVPANGKIELSLDSVINYNRLQLEMGQKFVFGTKEAIDIMKQIYDKTRG